MALVKNLVALTGAGIGMFVPLPLTRSLDLPAAPPSSFILVTPSALAAGSLYR